MMNESHKTMPESVKLKNSQTVCKGFGKGMLIKNGDRILVDNGKGVYYQSLRIYAFFRRKICTSKNFNLSLFKSV